MPDQERIPIKTQFACSLLKP